MDTKELKLLKDYVMHRLAERGQLPEMMAALSVVAVRIAHTLGVDRDEYLRAVQMAWGITLPAEENKDGYN